MDKYEYNLKLDKMKSLAAEGNYQSAADMADKINWNRVRNVNTLVKTSEIYEKAERYEDSRDVLLLAYDRSPLGRMIIYHLGEIAIKMNEFDEAQEYYDEFVRIAPHDNLRFVMQYDIKKGQGASNEELIKVLEEYKEQEYVDEWAYRLACLYDQTNQREKCVKACDELILWFGEGPYVEKALELKMNYQPLTKSQEQIYRKLHSGKKDEADSLPAEEVPVLPEAETVSDSKFNTVNLQEEISKGMKRIMEAKASGEVNEAMDDIQKIVDAFPYLQIDRDEEPSQDDTEQKIADSLKESLKDIQDKPEDEDTDENDGSGADQMSISDVLAEWEKTKTAAESALQEADQIRFESEKAKALQKAEEIMNRLQEIQPKLEAGITSRQLMEEEYRKDIDQTPAEEADASAETDNTEAAEASVEPTAVEEPTNEPVEPAAIEESAEELLEPAAVEESAEEPVEPAAVEESAKEPAETEDAKEVSEMVDFKDKEEVVMEDKDMILEPIDEDALLEETLRETTAGLAAIVGNAVNDEEEIVDEINLDLEESAEETTKELPVEEILAAVNEIEMSETEESKAEDSEPEAELPVKTLTQELEAAMEEEPEAEDEGIIVTEDEIPEGAEAPVEEEVTITPEDLGEVSIEDKFEELIQEKKVDLSSEEKTEPRTIVVDEDDLTEDPQATRRIPNIKEYMASLAIKEEQEEINKEKAIEDENKEPDEQEWLLNKPKKLRELTPAMQKEFSYFVPIRGMEEQLCNAINIVADHLTSDEPSATGNIIIAGEKGCGKTVLATSMIRVLQQHCGNPAGKVGKIDATALNNKDIATLMRKVEGGCLIIESAGELHLSTIATLSYLLDKDASGTLVILEDTSRGIRKLLSMDEAFSRKFTARIAVPVFTNDELVAFARSYAKEKGFKIDDMAILALYNRISNIQRLDQATTLTEVRDIVDEAIVRESKWGLRKYFSILTAKRYTEDDRIVLTERNFTMQ